MSTAAAATSALSPTRITHRLARLVLAAFVFTFIISRILVILIMSKRMPDLFLHMGKTGTHVHHLNYGIFLLSTVGFYLIFARPSGKPLSIAAALYGVGLGLTFDEFGMWLHLGGSYWQRASFDAVVIVAALLGLFAYAPALKRFRPHHWLTAILLLCFLVVFALILHRGVNHIGAKWAPSLYNMERAGPQ